MDNYKIAIAIAMSSNHNAVLAALSTHLLGVHAYVNQLTGGFNRLKMAIGGALAIGAGVTILDTMVKLVDKTKEYSHELAKLQNLGGDMASSVISGDMAKRAFDITRNIPVKVTDVLKIAGMTNSMLGTKETMSVLEPMSRLGFVLQSQKDYKGDIGDDIQNVMRAGELSGRITDSSGQIDEEKLKKYLELTTKITAATHGMVNPSVLLALAKQGGVSLRGLSDDGFYHMAIAAQAFGGKPAGTALMSTWQQLATGQMFTRTAEGMEAVGMLKPGEWHTDHGRVILDDAASKRLTSMVANDPLAFAHNMDENLKAQGVNDPLDRQRMIMRGLSRATTQRFTLEQAQNYGQIISEADRMKQGYGPLESLDTFMNKDVEANMKAVENAWTNLMMAVAGPNSENIIAILKRLTDTINSLQSTVRGMNPDTIMNIGTGLAVLAGALIGGGGIAILAAIGPVGWIAAGLIAIGAAAVIWGPAIKALAASEWDHIVRGFNQIKDAISGFIDWLSTLPGKIAGWFTSGTGKGAPTTDDLGRVIPQSFHPGTGGPQRQQFAFALNVDGDRLAQTVIDKIEAKYGFATGAAGADTMHHWVGGDHGIIG